MKVTIGTSDGETFQQEIDDASQLIGKKVGEEFEKEQGSKEKETESEEENLSVETQSQMKSSS